MTKRKTARKSMILRQRLAKSLRRFKDREELMRLFRAFLQSQGVHLYTQEDRKNAFKREVVENGNIQENQ